jgi:hypothetical protein
MRFLSFSRKGRRAVVDKKKAAVQMMSTVTTMIIMLRLMLHLVLTGLLLCGYKLSTFD